MRFNRNMERHDLRREEHPNWDVHHSRYQQQQQQPQGGYQVQASSNDESSWARWQIVHPGTPYQDYKNWYDQYGSSGATINGDPNGPFYNHEKNDQFHSRHDHDQRTRGGQSQYPNTQGYQPQPPNMQGRPGSSQNFNSQQSGGGTSDQRSWARWQAVHPGTSLQDYKNWYAQYGSSGATISGEQFRERPFYNQEKNEQFHAYRDGVENHVRSRNFAKLGWMTAERRGIWGDIVSKRDSERARQLIQTYEQEGDLDHGEWLRAQMTSWGGAAPQPVSNPHAAWLHRRGHRISQIPQGGFQPPPLVSPPELDETLDVPEFDMIENSSRRVSRPGSPHRAPESPRPPELNPAPPVPPQPFAGEFGLGTDIPSSKSSSGWLADALKPSGKTADVPAPVVLGKTNQANPPLSEADEYLIREGLMPVPMTVHGEFGVSPPAPPRRAPPAPPRSALGSIVAPIASYRASVQAPHLLSTVRNSVSRPRPPVLNREYRSNSPVNQMGYGSGYQRPSGQDWQRHEENWQRHEENRYGQNQYSPYELISGQSQYEGPDTTIYVAPPSNPVAPTAPTSDDSGIVDEVLSGVKGLLGMKDAAPEENDDGSTVNGEFGHPGGSQHHQNQKRMGVNHLSHTRQANRQQRQNQQQGGGGSGSGGGDDGGSSGGDGGDEQYSDDGSGDIGSEGWSGRRLHFSVNGGREERNNYVNAPIVSRGFSGGRYAWHNGDYVYVQDSGEDQFMGELQQLASWSRGGKVPDFEQNNSGLGELRQLSSWARGRQNFSERSPFGAAEMGTRSNHENKKHHISAGWSKRRKQGKFSFSGELAKRTYGMKL